MENIFKDAKFGDMFLSELIIEYDGDKTELLNHFLPDFNLNKPKKFVYVRPSRKHQNRHLLLKENDSTVSEWLEDGNNPIDYKASIVSGWFNQKSYNIKYKISK